MSPEQPARVPWAGMNHPNAARAPATVIDLAAVSQAARPLIDLYDNRGQEPVDRRQLDRALSELTSLPPVPGPLGRDIALLAAGGRESDPVMVAAAIERLRRASAVRPTPAPIVPTRRWRPRTRQPRRPRPQPPQQPLPGLGEPELDTTKEVTP